MDIAWTVSEIIKHLLFSWFRFVWPWMKVKVNMMNTWCILMTVRFDNEWWLQQFFEESLAIGSLVTLSSRCSSSPCIAQLTLFLPGLRVLFRRRRNSWAASIRYSDDRISSSSTGPATGQDACMMLSPIEPVCICGQTFTMTGFEPIGQHWDNKCTHSWLTDWLL